MDAESQYIAELKALIVELAEAVQYCHVYRINDATIEYHRELMQRARDAVSLSNGEATR